MRILVTGSRGKVGRAVVRVLQGAGHTVTGTDLGPVDWDRQPEGTAPYVVADLTDAGQVYALVGGVTEGENAKSGPYDAVVHCGALPAPGKHAPHVVFGNNLMATFNVVEACVRWRVPRLVNISSETATGYPFAERPFFPAYLPVDEDHPVLPQDPYGLSKALGEQLCDAAVRRSDLRCVSLRPTWVQDADSYARNLGPVVADRSAASITGWAYVDADDLADAVRLAAECDLPGHEVFYVAAPDTIGGRDLHASWRAAYPDAPTELRPVARPDASGISTAKLERLLGWTAKRTWRDHLTEAGEPLPR
ncbi:MAG TPA: NAD(P)-dependent oxidoreductase [Marmoricola sp.]|nr:NAD(P)-dependent oxidoreductase [Marmoricola sp.]